MIATIRECPINVRYGMLDIADLLIKMVVRS